MSNVNEYIKKAFQKKRLFTGFVSDPIDSRDYQFSDIMKKQGTLKTVKKKVPTLVNQKRGSYRKAGQGKVLKTMIVREDVPTERFSSNMPSAIDHSVNMSPVKDQGKRGTCVGFAGVAMKELHVPTSFL